MQRDAFGGCSSLPPSDTPISGGAGGLRTVRAPEPPERALLCGLRRAADAALRDLRRRAGVGRGLLPLLRHECARWRVARLGRCAVARIAQGRLDPLRGSRRIDVAAGAARRRVGSRRIMAALLRRAARRRSKRTTAPSSKLMGDGVMAAFGVPHVREDDAVRAVRAAVAIQDAFRRLAERTGRARSAAWAAGSGEHGRGRRAAKTTTTSSATR